MPLTLLPMIDPSAKAERNIVHLLLFLPVPRALPLFQSVVVFVVADGVIFHVAIVLSLAAITVVARVVEVEVHGGGRRTLPPSHIRKYPLPRRHHQCGRRKR